MKKNIKEIACLIFVALVGIMVFMAVKLNQFGTSHSIYIFSDISECENLIHERTETEFERYADASKDKELLNLTYNNYYAGRYASEELTFEIFAYEFEDDSISKQYFKNITGMETEKDWNFSGSVGMFQYCLVVIHKENAYCVYADSKYMEEVEELLANTFTIQLC